MKNYTALFAEDVPHYGVVEIEANDDEAALEAAKSVDVSAVANDAEWESAGCRRIVYLRDSDGLTVAEDVSLDDTFMRYGGEKEYRLCGAAPELLAAVQAPDLDRVHDRLSELLEDPDAGNDEIRQAAIDLCEALNAHHQKRKSAIAKAMEDQT